MDPHLFHRLWRRPWLSLCSLILSTALCFLVCFLTDYRQNQQQELSQTQKDFPITCVVTDIRGTKSTDLRMDADLAAFVTDGPLSGYVRQVRLTKRFDYGWALMGVRNGFASLTAINHLDCADILNPDRGGSIVWLTDEDIFQSQTPMVIVPESIYLRLQETPDALTEPLHLDITDPVINPNTSPEKATQTVEFRLAGYYPGSGWDLYMAYDAAQIMEGEYFDRNTCDSISFFAADNLALAALSETASPVFGAVDPKAPPFSEEVALTIHDQQYRATVTALEQNIARSAYLLPAVLVLSVAVGFLLGFLSTRSERKTYALMRTMGMTQNKLFLSVLREQLVLTVLAAVLALVITREIVPTAIYLLCNTVGCICSVMKSVNVPPTAILREQE